MGALNRGIGGGPDELEEEIKYALQKLWRQRRHAHPDQGCCGRSTPTTVFHGELIEPLFERLRRLFPIGADAFLIGAEPFL